MNKKGVLLVNLGSPDSTKPKDVKKYLDEFLMDPRVIDVPKWARILLVRGIILNTRPKQSAKAYAKIWWEEGSPLIVLSERLQKKVQEKVTIPVALVMRYGSMTLKKGLQELVNQGVTEVKTIPLYPQFAMATTETIDKDMISGMLTAIKSFVEDAFKTGNDNLESIEYGLYNIHIQNFKTYYIAVVVHGVFDTNYQEKLEWINPMETIFRDKLKKEKQMEEESMSKTR